MNWSSGSMSGTGKTTIAAGGVLNIVPGGSNGVNLFRVLENNGAVNWTSGYLREPLKTLYGGS